MTPLGSQGRGDFALISWLCRKLNQGRCILQLFLLGLLCLLFLSFAGALQSELSTLGAGNTELLYAFASSRHNSSLKPIEKAAHYKPGLAIANADESESSKHYFSLDPVRGTLMLREGLRSFSSLPGQENPRRSFPWQIVEVQKTEHGETQPKVVNLYIQLLECRDFLAKQTARASDLPEADAVLRCMTANPVISQPSTFAEVSHWIDESNDELKLTPTQKQRYLNDATDEIGRAHV